MTFHSTDPLRVYDEVLAGYQGIDPIDPAPGSDGLYHRNDAVLVPGRKDQQGRIARTQHRDETEVPVLFRDGHIEYHAADLLTPDDFATRYFTTV